MRVLLNGMLFFIIFSCNNKYKKAVKFNFPNAETAFQYFIDTTGLMKDKHDSASYYGNTLPFKPYKILYINFYDLKFKYGKRLYKKPIYKIVEKYNTNGQIIRRYLKFFEKKITTKHKPRYVFTSLIPYEKNIIHYFEYNKTNQLVKFYLLMDESSIDTYHSQLSGVHEFTYFNSNEKQDSVYINSYGFSGTYDNGSSMFFYDKIKNRIKDYLGFDYYGEKVKYDKQLIKTSKTEGLYITNYVMYNSDLKLKN